MIRSFISNGIFFFIVFFSSFVSAAINDADDDGVLDADDLCPLTTDLSGPVPTQELCDGCLGDNETVRGCNANDILLCKPGPNNHERKVGVGANAVDKFIAGTAWAKKCEFDEPPPPVTEVMGAASTENDLVLELPGARFTLPAGVLPDGSPVTFGLDSPDVIDPLEFGVNERPVSNVYYLSFSAIQRLNSVMTIEIDLLDNVSVAGGVYALTKESLGLATDILGPPEWETETGLYDHVEKRLTLQFAATSEMQTIVVVEWDPAGATTGNVTDSAGWKEKLFDAFAAVLGIGMVHATNHDPFFAGKTFHDEIGILDRGWIAVCRPSDFQKKSDNPDDCSSFTPELLKFAMRMQETSVTLHSRGFSSVVLSTYTPEVFQTRGIPFAVYDPLGASDATGDYFVVWVRTEKYKYFGVYKPDKQAISMNIDGPVETAIHELMHAALAPRLPLWAWSADWINESVAAASETWEPLNSNPIGESFRYDGISRNWALPINAPNILSTSDANLPGWLRLAGYTLAEMWLDADSNLIYFPAFIDSFDNTNPGPVDNAYDRVSQNLRTAGISELPAAFQAVIEARSGEENYPHCGALTDEADPNSPRTATDLIECATGVCELRDFLDLTNEQYTATCYRPDVRLPPSQECPGQEIYTMEFGGDPVAHRYIVDETVYSPGDTLEDAPVAFKLWGLNFGNDSAVLEPSILFRSTCPVDSGIAIVYQDYSVAANAKAFCSDSKILIESSGRTKSYDDESQPSTQRAFERTQVRDGSPDGQIIVVDNTVEIPPIGLGSFGDSRGPHVLTTGTPFGLCVGGESAAVNSSISTNTSLIEESDRAGVAITGNLSASRTIASAAFRDIDDLEALGSATYQTEITVEGSANVTINYGCDIEDVSMVRVDPPQDSSTPRIAISHHTSSPGKSTSSSGTANVSPTWVCATAAQTIGAGRWSFRLSSGTFPDPSTDGNRSVSRNTDFSVEVVRPATN